MNAEYEKARRHAENTLAEVNRHLDRGNIKNPQHQQMLTDMAEKATRILNNLDTMENTRPYSDTNIGYGARQRSNAYDDTNNAYRTARSAMDAINKILPQITDDMDNADEMEMRQGVPGTGPYANPRLRRRGGRKGIGRRRAEMDMYNADDMDDDAYDDMEMRRRRGRSGRFVRSDYEGYSDMDYNDERMHDAVARTAAYAAADTARRMTNDMRGTNDIYPSTPVMMRSDARYDARNDTRYDTRNDTRGDMRGDARSNADTNYNRSDDATSDRSDRYNPGIRR